MSEPYGEKWKKVKIWPTIQNNRGIGVNHIKINTKNLGAIGPTGPGGVDGQTGPTGPTGPIGPTGPSNENSNSPLQITSPNGSIYEIIVSDSGFLSTELVSESTGPIEPPTTQIPPPSNTGPGFTPSD